MRYQINSFEELDTQTLYEILSHRFEVFVLEQRCIYHDFDPFDKTALHMTAWDDAGNLWAMCACSRPSCIMTAMRRTPSGGFQ